MASLLGGESAWWRGNWIPLNSMTFRELLYNARSDWPKQSALLVGALSHYRLIYTMAIISQTSLSRFFFPQKSCMTCKTNIKTSYSLRCRRKTQQSLEFYQCQTDSDRSS